MDGLGYRQTLIQGEVGEDFQFREETLPGPSRMAARATPPLSGLVTDFFSTPIP